MAARKSGPRNKTIPGGVARYSRSQIYQKKALYKVKKATDKKTTPAAAATKTVQVKGAKNGGTRVVAVQKASKFYPVVDVPKPVANHKHAKAATLRASITPGTVLVLLAGPHRGKRVVFLKQLPSGLLLVTGPFKINGVPLKRVNQAYVLATSTKVDISKVNVDAKFTDAYFKAAEAAKPAGITEGAEKPKKVVADGRKADQKAVDAQLLPLVKGVPHLSAYLSSVFTLTKGQYPHALKF
eukprot:m.219743 g.219743  ORF g.219743 m.219743 type:complete len:240 (+) comp10236_c0_seq1:70-789(+)